MNRPVGIAASLLACAAVYLFAPVASQAQEVVSVRRVQVLGKRNPVEIEIEASDRLVPQAQILTDPDRLVVDFANAVPSAQLQNQKLNQGEVKSVRVGLFSSKPPVTRVVLDLDGPQAYQIFPSGRTVIIKVGSPGAPAGSVLCSVVPPNSWVMRVLTRADRSGEDPAHTAACRSEKARDTSGARRASGSGLTTGR